MPRAPNTRRVTWDTAATIAMTIDGATATTAIAAAAAGAVRTRRIRRGGDDRGFFDRAGDEVRSWFGDDEAQRRREMDERRWEQEQRMSGGRDNDPRSGGSGWMGGGWGNQPGESWHRDRPGVPGGWDRDRSSEREGWFSSSVGGERGERWGGSGGAATTASATTGSPAAAPASAAIPTRAGASTATIRAGSATSGPMGQRFASYRRPRAMSPAAASAATSTIRIIRNGAGARSRISTATMTNIGASISRSSSRSSAAGAQKRQSQRQMLGKVTEHMEVVGSDGDPCRQGRQGARRPDHPRQDRPECRRNAPFGALRLGRDVEDKVTLNRTAAVEAMDAWRNEESGRALFERADQGSEGPHALDRSFSGTYGGRNDD